MKKVFSIAGLIGILIFSPARAALIYDSVSGTFIATAHGANDGNQIVANSFALPSGNALPYVISLSLGAFGGGTKTSVLVYLEPDTGPANQAPTGPLLNPAFLIGSVSDDVLSTTDVPSIINFTVAPSIAEQVLSETAADEFWVVLDFNGSNDVWYTNDGSPVGLGAAGQAHYTDGAVGFNVEGDGPYLMAVQTPEPVSIALLGIGLLGLGAARHRARGS